MIACYITNYFLKKMKEIFEKITDSQKIQEINRVKRSDQ